jgi:hypothetical protein
MTVVLSGAGWIWRSVGTWEWAWTVGEHGGEGAEGDVDEGVEEVEGEIGSRLAPQPDSASQLRIASGSQPRRCQVER